MTEVKYIRPELIEAIARNTLKNYDASLLRCRTQGRLRFTAAHELAHWLIHQELY